MEVGIWGVFQNCYFDTLSCAEIYADGSTNTLLPLNTPAIGLFIQNARAYVSGNIFSKYGCCNNILSNYYTEYTRQPIVCEQAGLQINSIFTYGATDANPVFENRYKFINGSLINASNATVMNDGTYQYNLVVDDATVYMGSNLLLSGSVSVAQKNYLNNYQIYSGINDLNGSVSFTGTNGSSSTTTGAITVIGGIGLGGNLNIGSTDNATSATTGALNVKGGVYIGKNLMVGTAGSDANIQVDRLIARYGLFSNTTQSTDIYSGTFNVSGGVSFGKNCYIGGNMVTLGTGKISSSTVSTDSTTGALTVTGGCGIGKSLNVGGQTQTYGLGVIGNSAFMQGSIIQYQTDDATDISSGCLQVKGGQSIIKSLFVGGNLHVSGTITGSIPAPSYGTDDSTSTDSGALQIIGGIGIAGNGYFGGKGIFQNADDATDISSGALQITGGASIQKKLYTYRFRCNENATIGQDLTVIGDINQSGTLFQNKTNDSTATASGSVQIIRRSINK